MHGNLQKALGLEQNRIRFRDVIHQFLVVIFPLFRFSRLIFESKEEEIASLILARQKVYLYDLLVSAIARGGYLEVSNDLNIADVCRELHVVSMSASFVTKLVYYHYLYDYEQAHYFPGMMKNLRIDSRSVLERFKNYDNRNTII